MNLAEKMTEWGILKAQLNKLEAEIKDEVSLLGKTQTVGNVVASFSKGKGSYDYQSIVMKLEPEQEIVDAHSKTVVDWKSVAEASGMTDELKASFYTPSENSTVSIKLKED